MMEVRNVAEWKKPRKKPCDVELTSLAHISESYRKAKRESTAMVVELMLQEGQRLLEALPILS